MSATAGTHPGVAAAGKASPTRPGFVTWTGLAVVLTAAAVLSFDALRGLAVAVSIPGHFAWLLPVAVDAGAAVSCATWLSRRAPADAAQFARSMTWALLATTVVANAGQLGMHAHGITPPWWVAVAVGAIPPAVVGGCVHLMVLVGRAAAPEEPVAEVSVVEGEQHTGHEDLVLVRARELVAAGAGRGTLRKELNLTDHHARQLLAQLRETTTNGEAVR